MRTNLGFLPNSANPYRAYIELCGLWREMIPRHFLPQIAHVSSVVFPLLLLCDDHLRSRQVLQNRSLIRIYRERFGASS
jgi:hypothetical protein